MRRLTCPPRPDWVARVEAVGLSYHSHENGPYWDESACYEFSLAEVLRIESAVQELHRMCIDAAEQVIKRDLWSQLAIPPAAIPAILASWERDDFSLYGRFDLACSSEGEIKLLEYNADTPTALVEAAVVQWHWLQECRPGHDQFNSLHERLIAAWQRLGVKQARFARVGGVAEDEQTVLYLQDTFLQAGGSSQALDVGALGWDRRAGCFVDEAGEPLGTVFKLYPWEWLWAEPFSIHLPDTVRWLEPPWKMLLANKGLLPVLWETFPGHPLLLPAHFSPEPLASRHVRKPLLSREGANVRITEEGRIAAETGGQYGDGPFVYQAVADTGRHGGFTPVLGAWVVDHEPAGLGLREDAARITGNLSRFVPHFIA